MTRVLVAYASKRGSTEEIARAVADTLSQAGLAVDCVPAGKVSDVEPYDAVVLGSAVYIKRWRGDARRFLRKHAAALERRPFWVFSSGPTGDPDDIDPAWLEPPRIVEKVERLGAREHVVFGGSLPAEPRGRIERTMVERTPPEHRDLRDWEQIRAWAAAVASALAESHG